MSNFGGTYTINSKHGQWLGSTLLLKTGDKVVLTEVDSQSSRITFTSVKGSHLAGRAGEIRFHDGETRAVGSVKAPPPLGGGADIDYTILALVSGAAGKRHLRLSIAKPLGASEDSGGEYEGEED